jgi:hypothetical protein
MQIDVVGGSDAREAHRRNLQAMAKDSVHGTHSARFAARAGKPVDNPGGHPYLRPVLNHFYFYYSYSPHHVEAGD